MSISSISSPPVQGTPPNKPAGPPPPPQAQDGDNSVDGPGAQGSQGLLDIKA